MRRRSAGLGGALIPVLPFFAAAIRRERQTGFLFPKFGYSTRKGFYGEFPFFWVIDDSQDALISPIFYSNLGEGFSLEYRYILPDNQRGRFSGFFMQETARHDSSRFLGHTRQDWHLAPRTWLKVDAAGVPPASPTTPSCAITATSSRSAARSAWSPTCS